MALIYINDIIPILISYVMFSLLAMAHRVLLPNKYSAFLQFKEDEETRQYIGWITRRLVFFLH